MTLVGQQVLVLVRERNHAFGGPQALALKTSMRQSLLQDLGPTCCCRCIPGTDEGQRRPQLAKEFRCRLAVPATQQRRLAKIFRAAQETKGFGTSTPVTTLQALEIGRAHV